MFNSSWNSTDVYVEHVYCFGWSNSVFFLTEVQMNIPIPKCDRMLNHHCRRNPELHEELQIQAAVAAGDVCTVRRMLEQGYSPKIRDANGWTLLHFSAAKGKERCVRVFLEHGGQRLCLFFCLTVEVAMVGLNTRGQYFTIKDSLSFTSLQV